jgi:predicted nuclease of predicted toxin-antitoxin system
MKLLVDMNLSPRWTRFLSDAGIEAAHWSNLGAGNAPDAEIMAFAKVHDYVVFTHDLDFSAILAATRGEKPSVVQVRSEDVSPGAIGDAVVAAVRQTAEDLDEGALLTVEPNRMRVRLLPLRPR